jgi:hypothetical protein
MRRVTPFLWFSPAALFALAWKNQARLGYSVAEVRHRA